MPQNPALSAPLTLAAFAPFFLTSMIPFFSQVLMYLRIAVQPPPVWQVALSLVLLVGTIAGIPVRCARICRIGIQMYGNRATLPEIVKWLKYAKG